MGGKVSHRHCLGAEEGRGEVRVAAGGEETSLLALMPKRHITAPELRERDDRWLVCSLVWACEKASLLTEICLAAALFWEADKR